MNPDKMSFGVCFGGTVDATKSKYWPEFVNLYRAYHGTNAGLDGAKEFSDKKLKECIYSFKSMQGGN